MSQPSQWKRDPRPDPEVVDLIERVHAAALRGHIRTLVVVTANPLLEIEHVQAGELDNVRKHLLVGGLAAASQKILQQVTPD